MQEILHAFGIDWRLIVIQIVNFGLLMVALWYFLYTPVLKILRDRESLIKKGVEDAYEAEKALSVAETERVAILKEAHEEATRVVDRGTAYAEEKKGKLLLDAEAKVRENLIKAEREAEELKNNAFKESEAEIAKLALLGAEKILRKEFLK